MPMIISKERLELIDFEGFDVSSEVIVERSNMELSHLIFILYLLFLRIETYKRKTEEYFSIISTISRNEQKIPT